MILSLIFQGTEDVTPNIAESVQPPGMLFPWSRREEDITFNIAGGVHAVPNFHLGEDDITQNIEGVINTPLIFFLISRRGEDDIQPYIAEGVHSSLILFIMSRGGDDITHKIINMLCVHRGPNTQAEILLLKSQGVPIPIVTLFLISREERMISQPISRKSARPLWYGY